MWKILLWLGTLYIGMIEGVFFFADFSPGETLLTRSITAIIFSLFTGLLVGYNYPKKYWLALIGAWLPIVFLFITAIYTFRNPGTSDLSEWANILPVIGSVVGGYIGSKLSDTKNLKALYGLSLGLFFLFGLVLSYIQFSA